MYVDSLLMYSSQHFHSTNKIGHNQLTGAIPSEIGNMMFMESFDAGETTSNLFTT